MGFTVKQTTRAEAGGEMALVMFQAVGPREQRTECERRKPLVGSGGRGKRGRSDGLGPGQGRGLKPGSDERTVLSESIRVLLITLFASRINSPKQKNVFF